MLCCFGLWLGWIKIVRCFYFIRSDSSVHSVRSWLALDSKPYSVYRVHCWLSTVCFCYELYGLVTVCVCARSRLCVFVAVKYFIELPLQVYAYLVCVCIYAVCASFKRFSRHYINACKCAPYLFVAVTLSHVITSFDRVHENEKENNSQQQI